MPTIAWLIASYTLTPAAGMIAGFGVLSVTFIAACIELSDGDAGEVAFPCCCNTVTAGRDPIAGNDPQTLCNMINCGNHLMVYQDSNTHGTDMFSDSSLNPPLDKLIISWLDSGFRVK